MLAIATDLDRAPGASRATRRLPKELFFSAFNL
jgi:hypothetical protein